MPAIWIIKLHIYEVQTLLRSRWIDRGKRRQRCNLCRVPKLAVARKLSLRKARSFGKTMGVAQAAHTTPTTDLSAS